MRRPSLPQGLIAAVANAVAAAVLALSAGALSGAARAEEGRQAAVARERAQLAARLDRLREETAATEARASDIGDTLVDLAGDEARLRQRLDETGQRIATLERRIADDEAALDTLTEEQAGIRHELAQRRRELAVVLMALQRIGRHPPPALFAGGRGPTDVVRGAILLNAAIPGLDAEARALARTLSHAARLAEEEQTRWARLRSDLEAVEAERERLRALVDELERRRALSLYERDRASAELARLAEEAQNVEALLARLSQDGSGAASASVRRGAGSAPAGAGSRGDSGVRFPARRGNLPAPVAGTVVGRYGDPTRVGGIAEGRTIAALPESTVFAPMPATILYAAPFRSYGHVLILDAGDGYHMVLTGMAESFVEAGARVAAGAPVGRMGDGPQRSALAPDLNEADALPSARPLLYVELRQDGRSIDSHGWWRDTDPDRGRTSG